MEIGPPVSATAQPALEPSVPDMEIVRTQLVAQVLLHLERQLDRLVQHREVDGQRVVDRRERVGELDVDDRADDLNDSACCSCCFKCSRSTQSSSLPAGDFQEFLA